MEAETFRYTLDGELFVPKIAESIAGYDPELGYNGAVVELQADLSADLNWEQVDFDGYILWKLNFGIDLLNVEDLVSLNSYKLAVEHFCEKILPNYPKSIGLILYEGSARIWEKLVITENMQQEGSIEEFSLTLFSEYLHSLAAVLPEGLPAFALLDCNSVAKPLQLFNKERFPHIELALRGVEFPIFGLRWQDGNSVGGFLGSGEIPETAPPETTLGVIIPENEYYQPDVETKLRAISQPYRLIFESTITTSWDELAELKCFDLSPMGERMVDGFCAAGGKVSG